MGLVFNKICEIENLSDALMFLHRKNPRAGSDGIDFTAINNKKEEFLAELCVLLTTEKYAPLPVVYKRKPYYESSIKILEYVEMNFIDKIIEYAIKKIIYPIFDNVWADFSCAYRKGKGEKYAQQILDKHINSGDVFAISVDIKSYYKSIVVERLLEVLLTTINDSQVVSLIAKCMRITDEKLGIQPGQVLSSICANAYLDSVDWTFKDTHVIRYADNYIFTSKDIHTLEIRKAYLSSALANIGLSLNENKTKIVTLPTTIYELLT